MIAEEWDDWEADPTYQREQAAIDLDEALHGTPEDEEDQ